MTKESLDPDNRRRISSLGGIARARRLSARERTRIAVAAARARWARSFNESDPDGGHSHPEDYERP